MENNVDFGFRFEDMNDCIFLLTEAMFMYRCLNCCFNY